jgi:calcineurin-like phosphoesterase family protein
MEDKMSRIWFTSDCHFGHSNIIGYTNRPFKDVNHMNEELIKRWNHKVNPNDLVYHIGDFSFKSGVTRNIYEDRLNGTIVHILGNHDYNNSVKTLIVSAKMEFGNKRFLVQHRPPDKDTYVESFDAVLVGHVHNKWKHIFLNGVPIINIGTDVWGFEPITIDTILKYYDRIINESSPVKNKKKI